MIVSGIERNEPAHPGHRLTPIVIAVLIITLALLQALAPAFVSAK